MVLPKAFPTFAAAALIAAAPRCSSAAPLTLEQAVRTLWTRSPQLEAQREQWTLAGRDRWRRFAPNEPQLLFTNADDHTLAAWGLGETFAFPGKSLALARLDSARARAQKAELDAKRYELARLAAETYLDHAAARATVEIQRRNVTDLEALKETLRTRYEAGLATQAEAIGADLQLRQLKADLAAQADHAVVAERRLKRLLELPETPVEDVALPDDIPSALAAELAGPTPDLLRARAARDAARAGRTVAVWSQLPDLSISAQRNRYYYLAGSPNGKERTWTYSAAITLPVLFPLWERAEGARARSQAVLDESAARLSEMAADADAQDAAREYARSRARLSEVRANDLPLAEALMESTLVSYKSGKLGFAELVLARKTLADLRVQEIQLRRSVVSARLRCLDRCAAQEPTP